VGGVLAVVSGHWNKDPLNIGMYEVFVDEGWWMYIPISNYSVVTTAVM
jgi:hypothetical protein